VGARAGLAASAHVVREAPSVAERAAPAQVVARHVVGRTAQSAAVPAVSTAVPAVNAAPAGRLGEELALVSQIRAAVQRGSGDQALDLLEDYRQRFEQPVLGMEADALRVDALCRAGMKDSARAAAAAFQREWPSSPLQERVRTACP